MDINNFIDDYFYDWDFFDLDNFGVYLLRISDAAGLIAKILCLEGHLDITLPDKEGDDTYSLYDQELDKILVKEIDEYKNFLIGGIEKQTLKTAKLVLNEDESVNCDETYIKADDLVAWLDQRSIHIAGDWYAEYQGNEEELAEAAVRAIHIKREMQKRKIPGLVPTSDSEKIAILEKALQDLHAEKMAAWASGSRGAESQKALAKPLHTKERETLLKLVIGMATDGYGYDPKLPRSPIPKEIADSLLSKGISIDADTVRKWLKEATEVLPREEK